ncbi:MAG: efflux RND transporter permease subunit [Clostridiales Family XIII bacterium]|jgi:HAE1 family hydrophobic/amphiphilic exporter-1|nr:efflux RND transporter permease subunit [Clostridiales Family XIII bacterium]
MIKLSVKRPFTVFVMIAAVFILGYGGFRNMTPELLPELEFPYVLMVTTYPGASPEKVEQDVTKPLEQAVASLENLEGLMSQSNDNVSIIQLEFSQDVNLEAMTVDLLQTVDQVKSGFDETVSSPLIIKMSMDMMPVIVTAVGRDGMDTGQLSDFVKDDLQAKLEGIEGVAAVNVSGLVSEQVHAVVRQDKIDVLNAQVEQAVLDEFIEQEQELRDTQNELEDKLDEVKDGDTKLRDGLKELANKAGEGAAEIAAKQSELTQGKIALTAQQMAANLGLEAIERAESEATQLAIQEAIDKAIDDAAAAAAASGATLPPGTEDLIKAQVEAQYDQIAAGVAVEFAEAKQEAQAAVADAESKLAMVDQGAAALKDAQAQLEKGVITAEFEMSAGAAQIAAAEIQMEAALAQIDSGLEQIEEAKDTAVERADISGLFTMDLLTGILKAQNFSMPAGYVQEGNEDILVRVGNEVGSQEDFEQLVLMDMGFDSMLPVKVKDVCDVFMSDNLDKLYAKINGQDGVVAIFSKQSAYATAEVSNNIKERFDELSGQYEGLTFTTLMDQGSYIYQVVGTVAENLGWGALFAILILFLFLRDIRPTFVVLCSIPISLAFAIVLMYFSGVTINIISLSGLAVAVGMLVDNSIVVIENIFRLRTLGYNAVKAAVTGASQVAGAITSSTLTTICVFVPIVFVEGMTRKLFTDMALTLAYALLASLLIALTLVPAMASGLFAKMEPKQGKLLKRMLGLYDKVLVFALRRKAVVLLLVVFLLGGSIFVVMQRGFEYMPESDTTQLTAIVEVPEGGTFEDLRAATDEMIARVGEVDGIETIGAIAGDNTMNSLMGLGALDSGDDSAETTSTSYILTDGSRPAAEVNKAIEKAVEGIDAEIEVEPAQMMDMSALSGAGITIDLNGDDLDDLMEAARITEAAIEGIPGIEEVSNGLEDAVSELRYSVDRAKAAEYELTVAQVFAQVSNALTKERTAISVGWKNRTYEVVLENGEEEDLTPGYIENYSFNVTKKNGDVEEVHLRDLVTITEAESPATITRVDQKRQITVGVTIAEEGNVTLVQNQIEARLPSAQLPAGVTYAITGEGSTIMDAFKDLGWMLILGILLVYLIMVAQFQSLKSPFIVMFSIPLAFTGGFLALLITGKVLSVISLVGFVMLVGVIVNNAIVLVDYINQLRMEGKERVEAIREAGAARMRPILMTALTTVLGLSVMALGTRDGSEMMQPLAIVCIGGLLYATLTTMFVVPVIYDIFNKKDLRVVRAEDLVVDMNA